MIRGRIGIGRPPLLRLFSLEGETDWRIRTELKTTDPKEVDEVKKTLARNKLIFYGKIAATAIGAGMLITYPSGYATALTVGGFFACLADTHITRYALNAYTSRVVEMNVINKDIQKYSGTY